MDTGKDISVYCAYAAAADRLPPTGTLPLLPVGSPRVLRNYQEKYFPIMESLTLDNLFAIIKCPTGWGKTVFLEFYIAEILRLHTDWKVVISVSQRSIAPGWTERFSLLIDGKRLRWGTTHNLCINTPKKVKDLKRFISGPIGITPESRVLVTTHSCLVSMWNQFGCDALLEKTLFIIDECHHSQSQDNSDGDDYDGLDMLVMNRLGVFVSFLLNSKSLTGLILTTATFSRGDQLDIVPAKHYDRFKINIHVPFSEYWRAMWYLKTFQNIYIVYDGLPFDAFTQLLNQKMKHMLIYCPKSGGKFLRGLSKTVFIDRVTQSLLESNTDAYIWKKGDSASNAIIDLSIDTNRQEKIQFIKKHGDMIYAIIVVDMMKEGSDWPNLEQIIDFAPMSSSATKKIQKFGRGTRDHKDKAHFTYCSMLPIIRSADNQEMRQLLSESFGQLILGLVESSYFCPIVEWDCTIPNNKGHIIKGRDILGNYDLDERNKIFTMAEQKIAYLAIYNERNREVSTHQEMITGIFEELSDYEDNDDDRMILAEQIYRYISRKSKQIRIEDIHNTELFDVLSTGFDHVQPSEVIQNVLSFSSMVGNADTCDEMQLLLGDDNINFRNMLEDIKKLNDPSVLSA